MNEQPADHNTLDLASFVAIVLDLDGVITRTAKVHAAAWKTMFDEFLEKNNAKKEYEPFNIDSDYRRYVDGKPRYDGVRSFLQSRGISLPEGKLDDTPMKETICGLGNRKNQLFLQNLDSEGVETYETTLQLIQELRQGGYTTAVVSSSRNCQAVLEAAGIANLFDARVDGVDLERHNLPGKPAPDMFYEACRRLGYEPQQAIAVEDAVAGVQAAQAAEFGCLIGVNRDGDSGERTLKNHGADIVVKDLAELQLINRPNPDRAKWRLPSAFDLLDRLISANGKKLSLFLDYDGTLTPIVANPKDAVLSDSMHHTLRRLSRQCQIAVISGRDLPDVRKRVGIDNIWYAGSHGFDIAGPDTRHAEYQEGTEYLPQLDEAEQELRQKLTRIEGSLVERKRFSVAVHYRNVEDDDVETVRGMVKAAHSAHPELKLSRGKKVFEIQPGLDWDKGKALQWMMDALSIDPGQSLVVYIGDDKTDEDAFQAISPKGIGVLVAQRPQSTLASSYLKDPEAVERFLNLLADSLEET